MAVRFLIVDDNEMVRRGLRGILQMNPDWAVTGEAGSGLEAIELFEQSRPDVVILDFQMPGINGLETGRRLRETDSSIPIVLFTQHASADLESHAKQVGIRRVISKMDTFAMVEIIEQILKNGPEGD